MKIGQSLLLSLIIFIVVLIIAAYGWYLTGWEHFAVSGAVPYSSKNALPRWTAASGRHAGNIRFRNCVFSVVDPHGVSHSANVTSVLNGMAIAYSSASRPPATLYLDRPLNAFSFIVDGVNDSATVTTPAKASAWAKSAVNLRGYWRTI